MAIKLLTYGEQLAEVQAGITKVMNSQRYEVGGRVMWRADLPELHKREKDLQDKIATYGDVLPTAQASTTGRAYGVSFG